MSGRTALAEALFRPRRIALVGASADPGKNTGRAQRYLRRHGFTGAVFPVNPNRAEIDGERCYPELDAIEGPIDHAYILLPTRLVEGAVAAAARRGVPVVTILADGFADAGAEGRKLQERIVEVARAGGTRVVGPNSMGGIDLHAPCALCVNAALDVERLLPGRLGLISHSGSLVGTLLSRGQARGIGFAKMIGTGNEADLAAGEIGEMLVEDAETDAILLFLETIRRPDDLARMARRADAAGKPVIAYKLGRSEAGGELATSHTGAIAGSDRSVDAFFRAHGIVRVDQLESLLEAPALLIGRRPPRSRRKAASVMTTTGGGGAMVVDRLGALGVDVVPPTEEVVKSLAEAGVAITRSRLTDLTLAGTRKELVEATLGALLASDHSDAVVAVIGSSAQFKPQLSVEGVLAAARAASAGKPLGAFLLPQAEASLRLLAEAGIAGFRTPESCADAVNAYLDWRRPRAETAPVADLAAVRAAILDAGEPLLDERQARRVFSALGIAAPEEAVIADLDRFSDLPAGLRYPVAAKVLSPDIGHKTEAGGVALNLGDAAALKAACRRLVETVAERAPEARIEGILVQRMERGLAEAILGLRLDPQVGPVVALGLGGTLAEIYRDVALRIAPVGLDEAAAMIEEVKGLAPVRGYRGLPKGDLAELARAIAAFSDLARLADVTVIEAEINPLIVKGEGVAAVDALMVCDLRRARGEA
ncbi:MAG: acetate--CoA ligase family protein [Proteobacteria bacterium]|nr:acetate--CoA ligase family protein [Pseudomonadota bacterium]